MRPTYLFWSLLFLSACTAPRTRSQSAGEEAAVLAVVQEFFDAIASRDPGAGERLTVPVGTFVNVRVQNGRRVVQHFTNAEWVAGMPFETGQEREVFEGEPIVLVDGDVAAVWGRYLFEIDGEPSHRGVDVFNLVRTDDGWKIAGGAYTVVR